eukprot:CAMPEP_0185845542 /NCGR_PEP_ID=MMETSP1354-20130828/1485_1 /TAXON_ID=708628 /ORGANISM="Erythrolobus madagascarensis, Strain CCMP3276" /LENGTH=648 /DNA_ID=CAMNT_0028545529 /DNA_START=13 /DNA_END=1961 /DNA_ORIENTATION=-
MGEEKGKDEKSGESDARPLDAGDIALLKTYGLGPYATIVKKLEDEIKAQAAKVDELCGIKESDTGLAPPAHWDLVADKQLMQEEQPLQVARCTKILDPGTDDAKYMINVKQIAKYVVGLGERVAPADIEEGMRVGVERNKYNIQIPLPPKIDASVTMMTVEEKPDVTYSDVGGAKESIEKIREVVELPLLSPEKFVALGIDPPKGVLLYGPPGTGKTLLARAVANRTDACFIRVIGSELVQKYTGEGARMVRELFQLARSKKACIVFFDEVDAIGGARFDDGAGGDNEVQRTMLEIVNQLDGFDARGNIKVIMATNRPDTLDPALLRPGRLDRKIEVGLPDLEGRAQIFKIHARSVNCERDVRFELLARLCPNTTGADLRSVCTEAGMYAIRARRKTVTEKDFLEAINKVIKGYQKFSSTGLYMNYTSRAHSISPVSHTHSSRRKVVPSNQWCNENLHNYKASASFADQEVTDAPESAEPCSLLAPTSLASGLQLVIRLEPLGELSDPASGLDAGCGRGRGSGFLSLIVPRDGELRRPLVANVAKGEADALGVMPSLGNKCMEKLGCRSGLEASELVVVDGIFGELLPLELDIQTLSGVGRAELKGVYSPDFSSTTAGNTRVMLPRSLGVTPPRMLALTVDASSLYLK